MQRAFTQSFVIHFVLLVFFFLLLLLDQKKVIEKYNFDLIETQVQQIKKIKPNIVINPDKVNQQNKTNLPKRRRVFGVKRKTLTSSSGTTIAKIGNTTAKKEDQKILRDDESDSLPAPAEEFLITSMPRATVEIRPVYPKWAKEQKISGSVIFDILIDQSGKVRQAKLVKGLHPKLDKSAKDAMMKFKFRPAYIEKKPTAVRIKYAIKFILES